MPTAPDAGASYDVFISYSHTDADWVWNWLVSRLKAEGLAVCTDQESFDPGVPALVNMENAVAASRHTLLVLTPAYLASEWTLYEQILTQTQDPIGLRQRTLPVLRQPCEPPPRIAMLTYVNLAANANVEREFGRLVNAIRGVRRLPVPPSVPVGGSTAATTTVVTTSVVPAFDTAAVRELLIAAFSDGEFTAFCYDSFRPAYDAFTIGMSRQQKAQILVEQCERQGRMEALLAKVEQANPYQYGQFKNRLRSVARLLDLRPDPKAGDGLRAS
jgi:hypothetical protein